MKRKLLNLLLISVILAFCLNIDKASAQWTSMGPEGGYIKCMTRSASALYAVTGMYGYAIYKSTDSGNSWSYINSTNLPSDIRSIAVIGNMLFLGTGSGLYRSDDNGLTWVLKTNGFPGTAHWVNKLAVSDTTLFAAATSSKILRSTDYGETWTVQNTGITCNDIYALVATGTAIFTGGGSNKKGVFRSTNNGNSWQQVTTGMAYWFNGGWVQGSYPNVQSLGFNGTDLYVGSNGYQGIWKSSDNGTNWVLTNPATRSNQIYNAVLGDGATVYAASHINGIFRSADNGASFTTSNAGIDIYYGATTLLVDGSSVFTGTRAGLYKTIDSGLNWTSSDSGIRGHGTVFSGIQSIGLNLFLGTLSGGVYRSSDAGSTWSTINNGLPVNQNYSSSTNIYSSTNTLFGYGLMSTDDGNSWVPYNSPGGSSWGNEMAWIEHGTAKFALKSSAADQGVYRSLDNGTTWTLVMNGIDAGSSVFVSIYSDGTTLYLGTDIAYYYSNDNGENWIAGVFADYNGWMFIGANFMNTGTCRLMGISGGGGGRGIYRTTDNGANWIKTNDLLVHKFIKIGNKIWASGTNLEDVGGILTEVKSIFLSQDDGVNWIKVNGTLSVSTYSIAAEGQNIYTATYSPVFDIYRSVDNGVNWVSIGSGLNPNTEVSTLNIFDGKLFAGTQGHSLWGRNISDFTAPSQPSAISGSAAPCIGSTQTYSVTNVPGTNYTWQFPSGWIITEGGTTNSVTVTVGSFPGIVLVTPTNPFGMGPAQYLAVVPNSNPPAQPSSITGLTNPDEGSVQNYSVTNDPGVSYAWTFPAGWVQTAGGNTNSITVTVGSGAGDITVTPSTPCGTGTPRALSVSPLASSKSLNLIVFLEGLYDGAGLMHKAQGGSGDQFPGTTADQVSVELRNAATGAIEYTLSNMNLSTTGVISGSVPAVHNGNYFIYIKHRNSITVSSSSPVSFAGSSISYNFSIGVAQAFGSNMKDISGVAVAFAGEATQDCGIDSSDMIAVDNDNAAFASGYLVTDINGDGGVDSSDMIMVDNNNAAFIGCILPF